MLQQSPAKGLRIGHGTQEMKPTGKASISLNSIQNADFEKSMNMYIDQMEFEMPE